MIDFEQWYEQEIGSENKPEYEAAKWAWYHQQAKIDELQARVDEIASHVDINFDEDRDDDQHSYWSGYNQAMRELNDILKGNKDEN